MIKKDKGFWSRNDTMETLMALHRLRQLESGSSETIPFSQTADEQETSRIDDLPCSPHHSPSPAHLYSSLNGVLLNGLNGHIGVNSCKRHLDFENNLSRQVPLQLKMRVGRGKYQTPAVLKRNERERNRVKMVNSGFNILRQHVPLVADNKKSSKVDTLRAAVDYIKQLQELLGHASYETYESPSSHSDSTSMASPKSFKTHSVTSSSPASVRTASPSESSSDDDSHNVYDTDLVELAGWLH